MKIDRIISLLIWNVKRLTNTYQIIQKEKESDFQKSVLKKQQNGIKELKEKNGIKNILKKLKMFCMKRLNVFVENVEKNSFLLERRQMSFVQITANPILGENRALTMLKENVQYVPAHLQLANIQEQYVVHVNAEQNYVLSPIKIEQVIDTEDVYCLEAERTHTFALENGLLVSNCMDSLRYLISRKMMQFSRGKVGV